MEHGNQLAFRKAAERGEKSSPWGRAKDNKAAGVKGMYVAMNFDVKPGFPDREAEKKMFSFPNSRWVSHATQRQGDCRGYDIFGVPDDATPPEGVTWQKVYIEKFPVYEGQGAKVVVRRVV